MKIKYALTIVYSLVSVGSYAVQDEKPNVDIPQKFTVSFGKFSQEYDVVAPKGNEDVKIVYIPNFSDNDDMGEEVAACLLQKLYAVDLLSRIEAVVVPGDKANMLGTLLHQKIKKFRKSFQLSSTAFVILRSSEKGKIEHSVEYGSITGGNKILHSRTDQGKKLNGKGVLIFDDVVSTGGTLNAAEEMVKKYGCEVLGYACVATEGNARTDFNGKPLISLTHLPVYLVGK